MDHHYEVEVVWTGAGQPGPLPSSAGPQAQGAARGYSRDHEVVIEGKAPILASSDPAFNGDPSRHNPEELLVAALSECHMLWYLKLCNVNGLEVVEYKDRASGIMQQDPKSGGGRFTEVVLRPSVVFEGGEEQHDLAHKLHEQANELCFIANSMNFTVQHEPELRFLDRSATGAAG